MIIYPDIEIHQGNCVNLKHGSIEKPIVYDVNPLQAAQDFQRQGAEWLHLVDLDAVFENPRHNSTIMKEIIRKIDIPVQVGGGIRSMSRVDQWINAGAERVILGTAAVIDQRFIEEVCTRYPDRIVVSIDAKQGKVVSHGWKNISSLTAIDMARRYEKSGVAAIIYTDIDKYDEAPESSMANTTQIGTKVTCPVISSGTIQDLDDLSFLANLPNIAGAVIGWALFSGHISVADAVTVARQNPTKAALM